LGKYANYAQLVQGVSQVADESLTQSERLCLLTLAAFNVKTDPHPGNDKLMRACGVTTRQGLNAIVKKLLDKRLIQIVGHARGGRGMAVAYRIRTEDNRFPSPSKAGKKPASPELHVSDEEPATPELQVNSSDTRNSNSENPQLTPPKPATPELHPDTRTDTGTDKTLPPNPPRAGALRISIPEWIPANLWAAFIEQRRIKPTLSAQELLIEQLDILRKQGNEVAQVLKQAVANGSPGFKAIITNGKSHLTDNERLGLSRHGIHNTADYNAQAIRNAEYSGRLEEGTYQKIKKQLLASGSNFEDDQRVIAMCKAIREAIMERIMEPIDDVF
jgi:hypothetical protein